MEEFSLVVIGGGPAGLFCALRAAGKGRRTLIVEKKPHPGRKLLLSGLGQCNITHDEDIGSFISHYGDNGRFLKPALMNFQNRDLISFFIERGLPLETEPGGKVFPRSRKSSGILDILVKECTAAHVEIRCEDPVLEVSIRDERFSIRTEQEMYLADQLVIATGGLTYPATGSTGDGYVFARALGHSVTEVSPALAAVTVQDYRFSDLAGISFADVIISLTRAGRKIRRHTGDLLLTHSGLSGPGILDFSRFIRPGDTLRISFLPGIDTFDGANPVFLKRGKKRRSVSTLSIPRASDRGGEWVDHQKVKETLLNRISAAGNARVRTVLTGFDLPERFVSKLLTLAGIDLELTGAHLSKKDRSALIELLTGCPFVVGQLGGIHEAMVTRGGVSLAEIDPKTMESRLVPRLFFVGEVLDIDGDTGGYNLQAAFSTAALAAQRIVERTSESA